MHTIRVTSYLGDLDDEREILIIGPYPDADAVNAAIDRLDRLPDVRGNLDLEPSKIPPDAAEFSTSAESVAAATRMEDIADALFGP